MATMTRRSGREAIGVVRILSQFHLLAKRTKRSKSRSEKFINSDKAF